MDFIKTSSLRALIELTFQRNWNGLIWMSRKGVTTKRVKTVQTALSRTAPNRAVRLAEKRFTLGQITSVHLKSRPKFKTRPSTHHDPGSMSRGRPATTSRQPRTTMPREPGSKPRGRATCLAYHGRCAVRAGNYVPRPAEIIGQSSSVRPQRPTANPSGHDRSDRTSGHDPIIRPIVPTDRPNAAVDPKPVLKPDFIFSRPGLTLSRL
ncbi:unnamed protein product [Microthlaspi erraticum]|uniref:Uncharacterized protein n=1 Tax=Microthlaspi erraticum TaxID=1685480 RepID=A0A6D2JMT2_9BRAS|nr:unnamed protein product [Microthlaspi erraticum]